MDNKRKVPGRPNFLISIKDKERVKGNRKQVRERQKKFSRRLVMSFSETLKNDSRLTADFVSDVRQ
jgi:hypothetical protein